MWKNQHEIIYQKQARTPEPSVKFRGLEEKQNKENNNGIGTGTLQCGEKSIAEREGKTRKRKKEKRKKNNYSYSSYYFLSFCPLYLSHSFGFFIFSPSSSSTSSFPSISFLSIPPLLPHPSICRTKTRFFTQVCRAKIKRIFISFPYLC